MKLTIVTAVCFSVCLIPGLADIVPGCHKIGKLLNCASGNITSFPARDQIPPGLVTIDLSYNSIVHVPYINVSDPLSLKYLNLSHNNIKTIRQNAFKNLTALEFLDLSYNGLKGPSLIEATFKLELSDFHRLKELHLRGNPLGLIKRMTFTTFGYDYLEILDMSYCALTKLEHVALNNLGHLKTLNLSHNLLQDFDTLSFVGLTHLEKLDLSFNRITVVHDMHLTLTSSFHYINLDYNRISVVKDNAFSAIYGLKTLSMRHNHLHRFTQLTIPVDKLDTIKLDNNPWNCDCLMKWANDDRPLQEKNVSIICTYPSRHRGKDIFELSNDDLSCPYPLLNILVTLILSLGITFLLGALLMLLYHKRHRFVCCRGDGVRGRYVAVYTQDSDGATVHFDTESTFTKEELEKQADTELYA